MDPERRVLARHDGAIAHGSELHRVRPFHIHTDDAVLDDLARRLERTRWNPHPEHGWGHGTESAYLRALVEYWRDGYDWRREETRLDALPHFTATLAQTELHFVHVRSGAAATPLLLLHGWPDSFHRYHAVAPLLASAGYDVVVPSLPGFGFTPPLDPAPPGEPLRHIADALRELMTDVLGYPRFGIAGGDTGGALARILAIDDPDGVLGIHLTDLGWQAAEISDPLTWTERRYVARLREVARTDGAYTLVQATRPRSLAVGLTDSPVGLASWIVDRFHAWSDGDLDLRFGKDTLLTNIMIYWVTRSIGPSIDTYFAELRAPSLTPADRVDVPVGFAAFPHDIGGIPPRRFAERRLAIEHWTELDRGGHLGALEEPELYARDVIEFFHALGR